MAAARSTDFICSSHSHGPIYTGTVIQRMPRDGAGPKELRRAYLERILRQADQLPLFAGDGAQVRLSSVYTALLTRRSEAEADATHGRPEQRLTTAPDRAIKHLSALDVLDTEPRLVLLGGPGSGKRIFVNVVALSMAGELLGRPVPEPNLASLSAPMPREDDGDPSGPDAEPELLPVQVTLRDLTSQLPASGCRVGADTV